MSGGYKGSTTSHGIELTPVSLNSVVQSPCVGIGSENIFHVYRRELSQASDTNIFLALVKKYVGELGFTDHLIARVERDSTRKPLLIHAGITGVRSFDGLWRNTALTQYVAMDNPQPIFQSAIDDYIASAPFVTDAIRRNRRLKRLLYNAGFRECFHIPVSSSIGDANMLFSVSVRGIGPEQMREHALEHQSSLLRLAQVIDLIGSCRFPATFNYTTTADKALVFPKPRLLLTVLAKQDLTLEQAAAELGISSSTAHKQIAAIRKALGVKTNFSAVHRAMQLKLLD